MRSWWWGPVACVVAGVVVGVALWGQRDTRLYVEAAPPLIAVVGGVIAAVVWVLVVRHQRGAAAAAARTQATLDAAERSARARLIARLDHEIKNPVTAIRAGLANVSALEVSPSAAGALASIDEQAQRLSRLVADLRRLGELESAPIEHEPVDLTEVLGEVAAATADLPGGPERAVHVVVPEIPWPVGAIRGDRDLIFLAAMNLVANAVKFSPPGASIELRAMEEDHHVVVEVADTGIGIPDPERELVWEELSRGSAARAVPGSGIGLALVRTIVGRHGGDVSLRSRAGQGTVVRLRFPLP